MFALLETIPDTTRFMIVGYAVIFGVILLYLASLYIRNRRLRQDMKNLREVEQKGI
jgi:hypothetical protein